MAILIPLDVAYGCFHVIMAELNSCSKDHMAHKAENIYSLVLYRESFLTSLLEDQCLLVHCKLQGLDWVG